MDNKYTPEERDFLKQIGERIKYHRLQVKLSQEKLAFASDLDRTYIGSVERGERNIAIINLQKIAKALNVKLSDLLDL
ncbi:MAG: helix-turn-helix domain-containing protein [Tannerellaceae bacterium]|nr:helix-turn-helix domain-containing protein [Tannerellaceae bacterium]